MIIQLYCEEPSGSRAGRGVHEVEDKTSPTQRITSRLLTVHYSHVLYIELRRLSPVPFKDNLSQEGKLNTWYIVGIAFVLMKLHIVVARLMWGPGRVALNGELCRTVVIWWTVRYSSKTIHSTIMLCGSSGVAVFLSTLFPKDLDGSLAWSSSPGDPVVLAVSTLVCTAV